MECPEYLPEVSCTANFQPLGFGKLMLPMKLIGDDGRFRPCRGSDIPENILCSSYALKQNELGHPINNCGTDSPFPELRDF